MLDQLRTPHLSFKQTLKTLFPDVSNHVEKIRHTAIFLHKQMTDSLKVIREDCTMNENPHMTKGMFSYSAEQLAYMISLLFCLHKIFQPRISPPVLHFYEVATTYAIECSLISEVGWFGVYRFFYYHLSQQPG